LSITQNTSGWKLGLAIIGFLLWLLVSVSAETVNAMGWFESYRFMSGYVLGFLIAFSGFAFWEVVQGRAKKFLDPHPVFRWLSYLMLGAILLIGLVSILAEIFGNTNWAYNIGSLLGGLVVGLGVIPTIESLWWTHPSRQNSV